MNADLHIDPSALAEVVEVHLAIDAANSPYLSLISEVLRSGFRGTLK